MRWVPVILLLTGTIGLVTAAYMHSLIAGVAATGLAVLLAGVVLFDPDHWKRNE